MNRTKPRKRMKMQYKLLLLFAVVLLLPMTGFGYISARNLENVYLQNVRELNKNKISQTVNRTEGYLVELSSIVRRLSADKAFLEQTGKRSADFRKRIDHIINSENIYNKMSSMIVHLEYVRSIYLYHPSGESFYVNFYDTVDKSYTPTLNAWFREVMEEGATVLLPSHRDLQSTTKEAQVLSYISPIDTGMEEYAGKSSVVMINLDQGAFSAALAGSEVEGTDILLLDGDYSIIARQGNYPGAISSLLVAFKNQPGEGLVDLPGAGNALVYQQQVPNSNLRVLSVTDESAVLRGTYTYRQTLVMFTLAMSAVLVVVSFLISAAISKPIRSMEELTKQVKTGEPGAEYTVPQGRGMLFLKEEYDDFATTINDLMHQINIILKTQQRQEFEILQAQINPHFIYNTLNTIKWAAKLEGNSKIDEVVTAIINLLKSTLRVGQTYLPIEMEIKQIEDYIAVQKFRYNEAFEVEMQIDPVVKRYKTLPFVLQPIVENAIFHGLDMDSGNAHLHIGIHKSEGVIVYRVIDNGYGMSHEQLQSLRSPQGSTMTGIGLSNVNDRIVRYFGEAFGIQVDSAPGTGTTVTIHIPAIPYEEVEDESIGS